MSGVNHNLLVQVVRDLKAAKGWSRIQWNQVAREYLERSHLSMSLNTPAFRTRLSKLYHKTPNKPDKPEVTVTGTKSTEEQIEERRANAEAGGILIDLTTEQHVDEPVQRPKPTTKQELRTWIEEYCRGEKNHGEPNTWDVTQRDGHVGAVQGHASV